MVLLRKVKTIYNSRNSKGWLNREMSEQTKLIYNSRNSKGWLNKGWPTPVPLSTIVEILRVD